MARKIIIFIVLLAVTFGGMFFINAFQYSKENLQQKRALIKLTGISELSLSHETISLAGGLAACMGEIPGGYCYQSDCEIIAPPDDFGQDVVFSLEVRKNEELH